MAKKGKFYNDGIAYRDAFNHEPVDDTDITGASCNAIMAVDASGEVVVTIQDADVTIYCIQGVIYQLDVERIKATGTTATNFAVFL